jgi:epsin
MKRAKIRELMVSPRALVVLMIVRNRASEIATLLGDLEKIRQERRKAKANKTKYGGVGSDGGMSFTQPGGGRFGGFGSESVHSGSGGGGSGSAGYRGGGGYDSGGDGEFEFRTRQCLSIDYRRRASPQAAAEFDEYEGADDFADTRRIGSSTSQRTARPQPPPKGTPRAAKPVEKPKEVNLFDFGDDEPATVAPVAPAAAKQEDLFGGDGKLSAQGWSCES